MITSAIELIKLCKFKDILINGRTTLHFNHILYNTSQTLSIIAELPYINFIPDPLNLLYQFSLGCYNVW
jgi:hypothetical protein